MSAIKANRALIAAGIATLCFGIGVQCATAGGLDSGVRSVKVTYSDLDLSKPAGAQTLYKRIRSAARSVCEPHSSLPFPSVRKVYRQCVDNAIANAVAEVNQPTLAAVHREKSKSAG